MTLEAIERTYGSVSEYNRCMEEREERESNPFGLMTERELRIDYEARTEWYNDEYWVWQKYPQNNVVRIDLYKKADDPDGNRTLQVTTYENGHKVYRIRKEFEEIPAKEVEFGAFTDKTKRVVCRRGRHIAFVPW